jgi:hypothetical protein
MFKQLRDTKDNSGTSEQNVRKKCSLIVEAFIQQTN